MNFNNRLHTKKTGKLVFLYKLLNINIPQVLPKLMNRWFEYCNSNKSFVLYTGTGLMNWFALSVMYESKVSLNESAHEF